MAKAYKRILILSPYTAQDPDTVNTALSVSELAEEVYLIQQSTNRHFKLEELRNFSQHNLYDFRHFSRIKILYSVIKYFYYVCYLRLFLYFKRPDVIITFMLQPIAALSPNKRKSYLLFSCIYDIPPVKFAGTLDKLLHKKAWRRLKYADFVWSSDIYKAELTQKAGHLNKIPLVCHNVPALNEYKENAIPSKIWLRHELMKQQVNITPDKGIIMVRAGAIGEFGGIEETLQALLDFPDMFFLMMGRPSISYKEFLLNEINRLGLNNRVVLWDRPDDSSWKKAIEGADIGHLLHLYPHEAGIVKEMYELNSSLSNYRLFTYMAAGLYILSYNDDRMTVIHQEVPCFYVVDKDNLINSITSNLNKIQHEFNMNSSLSCHQAHIAYKSKYNWEMQFQPIYNELQQLALKAVSSY